MSYKHLLTKSHPISEKAWWYEDNGGIDVIVHPDKACQHLRISWRALREALKRKDRKP